MFVSYQILRCLAPDGMTAAEQREADEQLGRIAAAVSQSRRRFAERTRALAGVLAATGRWSTIFRKVGQPGSPPAASGSAPVLSHSTRNGCETQLRNHTPLSR
jgi:hypothetical protein